MGCNVRQLELILGYPKGMCRSCDSPPFGLILRVLFCSGINSTSVLHTGALEKNIFW
jgi:hypothetical protein